MVGFTVVGPYAQIQKVSAEFDSPTPPLCMCDTEVSNPGVVVYAWDRDRINVSFYSIIRALLSK